MEGVSRQLATVTASIGETGSLLDSAVAAVKQADPGATIQRIDAVARIAHNLGTRLDEGIQLHQSSLEKQEETLERSSSSLQSLLEGMDESLRQELRVLREEIAHTKSRVAIALGGAWIAALLALGVLVLHLMGAGTS
jgi:hypothetical protein